MAGSQSGANVYAHIYSYNRVSDECDGYYEDLSRNWPDDEYENKQPTATSLYEVECNVVITRWLLMFVGYQQRKFTTGGGMVINGTFKRNYEFLCTHLNNCVSPELPKKGAQATPELYEFAHSNAGAGEGFYRIKYNQREQNEFCQTFLQAGRAEAEKDRPKLKGWRDTPTTFLAAFESAIADAATTNTAPPFSERMTGVCFPVSDDAVAGGGGSNVIDLTKINTLTTVLLPPLADIPGVTEPVLCFGRQFSIEPWRKVARGCVRIYCHVYGGPKEIFIVKRENMDQFRRMLRDAFPTDYESCPGFLEHLTCYASPAALRQYKIVFSHYSLREGQTLLVDSEAAVMTIDHHHNCCEVREVLKLRVLDKQDVAEQLYPPVANCLAGANDRQYHDMQLLYEAYEELQIGSPNYRTPRRFPNNYHTLDIGFKRLQRTVMVLNNEKIRFRCNPNFQYSEYDLHEPKPFDKLWLDSAARKKQFKPKPAINNRFTEMSINGPEEKYANPPPPSPTDRPPTANLDAIVRGFDTGASAWGSEDNQMAGSFIYTVLLPLERLYKSTKQFSDLISNPEHENQLPEKVRLSHNDRVQNNSNQIVAMNNHLLARCGEIAASIQPLVFGAPPLQRFAFALKTTDVVAAFKQGSLSSLGNIFFWLYSLAQLKKPDIYWTPHTDVVRNYLERCVDNRIEPLDPHTNRWTAGDITKVMQCAFDGCETVLVREQQPQKLPLLPLPSFMYDWWDGRRAAPRGKFFTCNSVYIPPASGTPQVTNTNKRPQTAAGESSGGGGDANTSAATVSSKHTRTDSPQQQTPAATLMPPPSSRAVSRVASNSSAQSPAPRPASRARSNLASSPAPLPRAGSSLASVSSSSLQTAPPQQRPVSRIAAPTLPVTRTLSAGGMSSAVSAAVARPISATTTTTSVTTTTTSGGTRTVRRETVGPNSSSLYISMQPAASTAASLRRLPFGASTTTAPPTTAIPTTPTTTTTAHRQSVAATPVAAVASSARAAPPTTSAVESPDKAQRDVALNALVLALPVTSTAISSPATTTASSHEEIDRIREQLRSVTPAPALPTVATTTQQQQVPPPASMPPDLTHEHVVLTSGGSSAKVMQSQTGSNDCWEENPPLNKEIRTHQLACDLCAQHYVNFMQIPLPAEARARIQRDIAACDAIVASFTTSNEVREMTQEEEQADTRKAFYEDILARQTDRTAHTVTPALLNFIAWFNNGIAENTAEAAQLGPRHYMQPQITQHMHEVHAHPLPEHLNDIALGDFAYTAHYAVLICDSLLLSLPARTIRNDVADQRVETCRVAHYDAKQLDRRLHPHKAQAIADTAKAYKAAVDARDSQKEARRQEIRVLLERRREYADGIFLQCKYLRIQFGETRFVNHMSGGAVSAPPPPPGNDTGGDDEEDKNDKHTNAENNDPFSPPPITAAQPTTTTTTTQSGHTQHMDIKPSSRPSSPQNVTAENDGLNNAPRLLDFVTNTTATTNNDEDSLESIEIEEIVRKSITDLEEQQRATSMTQQSMVVEDDNAGVQHVGDVELSGAGAGDTGIADDDDNSKETLPNSDIPTENGFDPFDFGEDNAFAENHPKADDAEAVANDTNPPPPPDPEPETPTSTAAAVAAEIPPSPPQQQIEVVPPALPPQQQLAVVPPPQEGQPEEEEENKLVVVKFEPPNDIPADDRGYFSLRLPTAPKPPPDGATREMKQAYRSAKWKYYRIKRAVEAQRRIAPAPRTFSVSHPAALAVSEVGDFNISDDAARNALYATWAHRNYEHLMRGDIAHQNPTRPQVLVRLLRIVNDLNKKREGGRYKYIPHFDCGLLLLSTLANPVQHFQYADNCTHAKMLEDASRGNMKRFGLINRNMPPTFDRQTTRETDWVGGPLAVIGVVAYPGNFGFIFDASPSPVTEYSQLTLRQLHGHVTYNDLRPATEAKLVRVRIMMPDKDDAENSAANNVDSQYMITNLAHMFNFLRETARAAPTGISPCTEDTERLRPWLHGSLQSMLTVVDGDKFAFNTVNRNNPSPFMNVEDFDDQVARMRSDRFCEWGLLSIKTNAAGNAEGEFTQWTPENPSDETKKEIINAAMYGRQSRQQPSIPLEHDELADTGGGGYPLNIGLPMDKQNRRWHLPDGTLGPEQATSNYVENEDPEAALRQRARDMNKVSAAAAQKQRIATANRGNNNSAAAASGVTPQQQQQRTNKRRRNTTCRKTITKVMHHCNVVSAGGDNNNNNNDDDDDDEHVEVVAEGQEPPARRKNRPNENDIFDDDDDDVVELPERQRSSTSGGVKKHKGSGSQRPPPPDADDDDNDDDDDDEDDDNDDTKTSVGSVNSFISSAMLAQAATQKQPVKKRKNTRENDEEEYESDEESSDAEYGARKKKRQRRGTAKRGRAALARSSNKRRGNKRT